MSKKDKGADLSKLSDIDYMAYTQEAYDAVRHMSSGHLVHVQVWCHGRKNYLGDWQFGLRYVTGSGSYVVSSSDWDLASMVASQVVVLLVRDNNWEKKETK
jgi:hypothetical protein